MITKIEIRNLSYQFSDGHSLFENLNAELPTNEIVFFDGGIGSGRSMLLKMMAALVIPKNGSVIINDKVVSDLSFEEFLPIRLKIGYSFEYAGLLSNRTLRENLLLPIQYHSFAHDTQAEKIVEELLCAFKLESVAHSRPSAVSGSQRKACIVARAFALDPEMVLLDEPFAGLSTTAINEFKKFVSRKLESGNLKHVYLTCQNPRDIEGWATKKILVERNQLTSRDFDSEPDSTQKGAA